LPIRAEHFDHWLALWSATCTQELDEAGAAQMIDYAQRIGRSLKYGIGLSPDARGIGVPLVSVSR
jgi:hemoglobin